MTLGKVRFTQVLKLLVGVALVGALIYSGRLEFDRIKTLLRVDFLPYLFGAFGLLFAGMMLVALRQSLLVGHLGSKLRWSHSLRIVLIGLFFNNFIPGGTGGDFARLYYLKKGTGRSYFELGGAVLVDRLMGLSGLAVFAFVDIAVLMSIRLQDTPLLTNHQWFLFFAIISTPLLAIIALLFMRLDTVSAIVIGLIERISPWERAHSFATAITAYAKRRRLLLLALLISVVCHFLQTVAISLLALFYFDAVEAVGTLFLSPIIMMLNALPVTPGNIGWTEVIAEGLMSMFSMHGGATIFITWRVVVVLFSLSGLWLYAREGAFSGDGAMSGVENALYTDASTK